MSSRPKRCPPGQIWVCWDGILPPQRVRVQIFPPQRCSLYHPMWSYRDSMPFCRAGFRRTFGRAPHKNQAWLIDTTRREWWCPACGLWHDLETYDYQWNPELGDWEVYCSAVSEKLTKSRCIVIKKLKLTASGVKEMPV